ncbi:MAG: bifunctional phosphopantothenoylcysteine decarboxylase/phosphopantothenate--cysteine ligase CoaBC [Bdellovibrionales bacterium]|nr:bifunctional phosphopantothenoylcysteine decarboxylase/phosphopantothenate--cysteine ligase CoaBC [Bdellovibrionales bacterium]
MRICLGICGSIAAYRSADFVKELVARGHEVRCVLTRSAREFVTPRTLETFSGQPVLSENVFDASHFSTDHIATARWAEAFVIYGATANFLARAAMGLADDFLSLQLLAFTGEVIVAPAMNPTMWAHPAVQQNAQTLRERGYHLVGPIAGLVACGETGEGHIAEHRDLFAALDARPQTLSTENQSLLGKRVLISAGPMRSPMDPVRYVQNRSSGLMGLELARACREMGAEVTVLLGPVTPEMARDFATFKVTNYVGPADYRTALDALFPHCDLFFSAAAVLDFELVAPEKKMERGELSTAGEIRIPLKPVPDMVAAMSAQRAPHQRVIAFAAETGTENDIVERATQKMIHKHVDALIANPVWPGLGPDAANNQVWVLRPDHRPVKFGPGPKANIARSLLAALTDN